MNQEIIKDKLLTYRLLHNKQHREILEELLRNKLNVTQIQEKFGMEQSVTSQHLSRLRRKNLVKTERSGKYIFYSGNKEVVNKLLER